jgi:hypothetical protein
MAISRIVPSGSTDGNGIKVTGTGTGTTVTFHTAHASSIDEIHLWAYNDSTTAVTLTLELGGTTDPDNLVVLSIPPQAGLVYVLPGHCATNSKTVKAFAGTANVIVLYGYVNRIS